MKIDVSKIENYESMTAEEKLKALEEFEFEDNSDDLGKLKSSLNKANHEASEYKKALKELQEKSMSEAERAEAERAEIEKSLREQVEALTKEKTTASYKANLLANGYDDTLATSTAEALVNGDMTAVFASIKSYGEAVATKAKNDLLGTQPILKGGEPPKGAAEDKEVKAFREAMGL